MLVEESLTKLAELIRTRSVSPVEVAEAHLNKISKLNDALNAIVTMAPDLLDRARVAEAAIMRGDELGALHGLPLTIKDTIETAGLLTTSGSKLRADFVPTNDAPSVARLKAAGAIVLGKTNAAEMAMDYNADNPVFGRTNHPLNPSLTPGGSSGGEAAAISTFMSPGGLGTDLAGSIRIPAHFCGIAGLKPTCGRVPGEGQYPPSTGPYSLGAVIGPMARTVEDLRLLFRVLSNTGAQNNDPALTDMTVAWYTDDGIAPVSDETVKAVTSVAEILKSAGMKVTNRRPPNIEHANSLWLQVFSRASVVQLRKVYAGEEGSGGSFVSWRLRTADDAPVPSLDEYIESWMRRDRLREELLKWMETMPILLCPVGATPAFKHDTLKVNVNGTAIGSFRAFSYSQAFNVFDLPVVTIPAGKSKEGLPIGVQIVGRPAEEELVLKVAEIVEKNNVSRR
ncbi:MAG: amidase [Acidobacteria bacterium]|nr:MAG: amidase [Acidobacteriota bacterium]